MDRHIHIPNPIGEVQGVPFAGIPTDERVGTLTMLGRVQFQETQAAVDFAQNSDGDLVAVVVRDDGVVAGRFKIAWADVAYGLMASLDDMVAAQRG